MIREEFPMPKWIGWAKRIGSAIRRFTAMHGAPHIIVLSPTMRRRMSVAACASTGERRYRPLQAFGSASGVIVEVVEEKDARDGRFALVRVATKAPRPAA